MQERYLGSTADQEYVRNYLQGIRKLDPIEIATLPDPINLADTNNLKKIVDVEYFWEKVDHCVDTFKRMHGLTLTELPKRRCYVAVPQGSEIGGFHHIKTLGYQYWYQASFVVTLNPRVFLKELVTVELIRDYLHDCLHNSTFRSFRRAVKIPASSPKEAKRRVPEIYREQYGINFRNEDGVSYSAPDLTERSPESINLNLLMDGVVVLVTADLMGKCGLSKIQCEGQSKEVLSEIFLRKFNPDLFPEAYEFYTMVTKPSMCFLEHWGKDELVQLTLNAMISGNLQELRAFFARKLSREDAWEMLFKRPEFSLPE